MEILIAIVFLGPMLSVFIWPSPRMKQLDINIRLAKCEILLKKLKSHKESE